MHDVNDEDGHVAEGGSAVAQVGEGLVAGSVDDQQAGQPHVVELEGNKSMLSGYIQILIWHEVTCAQGAPSP